MFTDCICGMVDCPNSIHLPSHVHSPSKVFCKEYFSPQHNSLDHGSVPVSNVYPPFIPRPNFQFHDNGIADVRRRKPSPKYDPRKLRSNLGRNNHSQFRGASATRSETHFKRKKIKFWGDSENLMDPPPQKIAYYQKGSRPSDMTVVSFK